MLQYLQLSEGRKSPVEAFELPGTRGPAFPLALNFKQTYNSHILFDTNALNHLPVSSGGVKDCRIWYVGDCLYYNGVYYGAYSLVSLEPHEVANLLAHDGITIEQFDFDKANAPRIRRPDRSKTLEGRDLAQVLGCLALAETYPALLADPQFDPYFCDVPAERMNDAEINDLIEYLNAGDSAHDEIQIGERRFFKAMSAPASQPGLVQRSGQSVTVGNKLESEMRGFDTVGPMYYVKFDDGFEAEVMESEIAEPVADPKKIVTDTEARQFLSVLIKAIKTVDALISDSAGVYGLHRNGDNAPWSDLRTGGEYSSWLGGFDTALEALNKWDEPGRDQVATAIAMFKALSEDPEAREAFAQSRAGIINHYVPPGGGQVKEVFDDFNARIKKPIVGQVAESDLQTLRDNPSKPGPAMQWRVNLAGVHDPDNYTSIPNMEWVARYLRANGVVGPARLGKQDEVLPRLFHQGHDPVPGIIIFKGLDAMTPKEFLTKSDLEIINRELLPTPTWEEIKTGMVLIKPGIPDEEYTIREVGPDSCWAEVINRPCHIFPSHLNLFVILKRAPLHYEQKRILEEHGYYVGARDKRINTDYPGKFMVCGVSPENLDCGDYEVPTKDASSGIDAIVGDDWEKLMAEAYAAFVDVELPNPQVRHRAFKGLSLPSIAERRAQGWDIFGCNGGWQVQADEEIGVLTGADGDAQALALAHRAKVITDADGYLTGLDYQRLKETDNAVRDWIHPPGQAEK